MGLVSKLRGELVDIIEWVDDTRNTLVWRFPRYQNEIKNGAHLIVRPGQCAIFVDRGRVADVFQPGTYELTTKNVPLLSTLRGWKSGFNSPFKAEVYFVTTRQVTELKWGTPHPVLLKDPQLGSVRVRAFGTYTLRAVDPKTLLAELVGTDGSFETDEIDVLLRSMVVAEFSKAIASREFPVTDLASHYSQLSEDVRNAVKARLGHDYGLDMPEFVIVNVSVPEEVEGAVDARASMGVVGDVNAYQQYQLGASIPKAAVNPAGGLAGAGVGLGMGMAIAGKTAGMNGAVHPPALPIVPAGPDAAVWHTAVGAATTGPFTVGQLTRALGAGEITAGTLVWTYGMEAWTPLSRVPALSPLVTPPPPPAK